MKKFLIIALTLLASFALNGCNRVEEIAHKATQNNCPPYLWDEYQTYIQDVNRKLWGNGFITSPETFIPQAHSVAYTIEKDKPLSVTFIFEEDTGRTYDLPKASWTQRLLNDYEYREKIEHELMGYVLNLQDGDHSVRNSGKIVATMLEWRTRNYSGYIEHEYALCDLDGDGVWDYLTGDEKGSYLYPDLSVKSPSYANRGGFPHRCVNKNHDIYFASNMPIVDLAGYDLAGKTLKDFEELL